MIVLDVPGFGVLRIAYVVCDFNGTLACDGRLIRGVAARLQALSRLATLHVVTADTFGTARAALSRVPCEVHVIDARGQAAAKRAFVRKLGADRVAAIGNGRNDRGMFAAAALAIAVCGREGLAREALLAADVLVPAIVDALDFLLEPKRAIASLRD